MIKINTEIIDYIEDSDYDKDIKNFLIEALLLEFRRDKADYAHYSAEYDRILDKYVR